MKPATPTPETTTPQRDAPYSGKNLNKLPPDEVLQELLMEAKREFDWWASITHEQFDEIAARVGGVWNARVYMQATLLDHLNAIICQLPRAPFTKELCK